MNVRHGPGLLTLVLLVACDDGTSDVTKEVGWSRSVECATLCDITGSRRSR